MSTLRGWGNRYGLTTLIPLLLLVWAEITVPASLQSPQRENRQEVLADLSALVGGSRVCDAVSLMDRRGWSGPDVLFAVDHSGRGFCNEVIQLDYKGPQRSVVGRIETWMADDLSEAIRDVDGDGRLDLVLPRAFSQYDGGDSCVATTVRVYECAGTCVEKTTDYSRFLIDRLDTVERRLGALLTSDSGDQRQLPCVQMESDKLRRMLRIDSTAGFASAEQWMKSTDSSLRRKAVAVFSDIDDEKSRRGLEALTKDEDVLVGRLAREALSRLPNPR